ncbi:DUF2605 domain-containing protein [Lusitaniella coriacea]|uniref:DUF2605 domain-containing protein n=1 Tax=Lusitaniella coriacea TaxID=1983105 RepID=UPI003CE8ED5F
MSLTNPSNREILKTVLEPLLEDFLYWFSRSRDLLESETIEFLSSEEHAALLAQLQNAQKEVHTAQILCKATNGQAGIETKTMMHWHNLVTQCWKISSKWRSQQNKQYRGIQFE